MADQPVRAVFNERQILGSNDLNLVVDHTRNAGAQTTRSVTTSGIFEGLRWQSTDVPVTVGTETVIAKQLRITRGIARDDFGRIIVVADDVVFGEDFFEQSIGRSPDIDTNGRSFPCPIFLEGIDTPQTADAAPSGRCGGAAGPIRVTERFEVRVGQRGEELPKQLRAIAPTVGADGDGTPRPLLLGFVRYHPAARRYVEAIDTFGGNGRHDAGIRAAEVVGRSGQISIRTNDKAEAGTPTVVLDRTDGARLLFGTATATGTIDELFRVDARGDLFVKGSLHAKRTEGQVAIESGVINHGVPLPLPAGVTREEVTSGSVVLHVTLSPMYPPEAAAPADAAYAVVELREVGGQVVSRYARFDPAVAAPAVIFGVCRYQIVAAVPPAGVTP